MSAYEITCTATIDPEDFEFWSGARSRMDGATDEQREQVFERIAEFCECSGEVRDVDINDLVWFECDDIFFPEEEEDEEEEEEEDA